MDDTDDLEEYYLQLAEANDLPLSTVRDNFCKLLADCQEHIFRSTLPANLEALIGYAETMPTFSLEEVLDEDIPLVKGMVLDASIQLGFVTAYLEAMSEEA